MHGQVGTISAVEISEYGEIFEYNLEGQGGRALYFYFKKPCEEQHLFPREGGRGNNLIRIFGCMIVQQLTRKATENYSH